jgi:2-C-methyl-D-erythritol 4-phosphate cytidylyltransferase
VVVPAEEAERARRCLGDGPQIVAGGPTRAGSVRNGLDRIEAAAVVVHDAVRPFAGTDLVHEVLQALPGNEGAIAAVPVEETIKRLSGDLVTETVDREHLWRAQTPQAFRAEALRAAHRRAERDGFEPTDDAQLVERDGGRVVVVAGSRTNLKITYPEDFELAEAILGAGT